FLNALFSVPLAPIRAIRGTPFPALPQFGNPSGGNINPTVINNIRYVNPGTSGDVSAMVDAAVILAPKGQVIIAPGTYTTPTTMSCQDNNWIFGYGVRINHTG